MNAPLRAAIAIAGVVLVAGVAARWHHGAGPMPRRERSSDVTERPAPSRASPPAAVSPGREAPLAATPAPATRPGAARPPSPLEAAGFILPERPEAAREWLPRAAPVSLDETQLVAHAAELEARVLEDDRFHARAAIEALEPSQFETLVAALAAQSRHDPGAAELAANFRARLERQYREGNGPARVDRLVCGLRLCVSQETTFGEGRGGTLGVGSGQAWPQPDGTTVVRTITSVERGIPHHVRDPVNR